MTSTTYSPIASALSELTSTRAQQYYAHKAQRGIQTTLDAALTVYCMAAAVAQFLIDFYAEYNAAALPEVVEVLGVIQDDVLLLPAPRPRLLLAAQTLPHPDRDAAEHRQLRRFCKAVLISATEPLPNVRDEPILLPAGKAKRGRKAKAKA